MTKTPEYGGRAPVTSAAAPALGEFEGNSMASCGRATTFLALLINSLWLTAWTAGSAPLPAPALA